MAAPVWGRFQRVVSQPPLFGVLLLVLFLYNQEKYIFVLINKRRFF